MSRAVATKQSHRRPSERRSAAQIVVLLGLMAGGLLSLGASGAGAPPSSLSGGAPVPSVLTSDDGRSPVVLAYYYIWFETASWDRAKIDLPTLGRYASADAAIIAQHVAWAKAAGIDALIVSWKHEARLDAPLELLVEAARENGLELVLLYQGLDFYRHPLPVSRIADDLKWFMGRYGRDPVFDVFGKPAIIMSGTPSFDRAALSTFRTTLDAAGPALLLGSEREVLNYAALADLLDGDAYYWSSVDPSLDRNYRDRLQALGDEIRSDHGLWLAPVAPGFDARLIGGKRVIARADGATYRTEWATALATKPDGLAIISWNEFSENSYIEPSRSYGSRYLEVTADLVRTSLGRPAASDPASAYPTKPGPTASATSGATTPPDVGPSAGASADPGAAISDPGGGVTPARLAVLMAGLLILVPVVVLIARSRRANSRSAPPKH